MIEIAIALGRLEAKTDGMAALLADRPTNARQRCPRWLASILSTLGGLSR
jgi:hypothetical protein